MLVSAKSQADILDVISNLSSDEVFTPPPVANAVLDLLPEEVWSDPKLRWLDPGTKTGVFLREAARRLMGGLEKAIPDEDERREHILKNMLYGAAITELTSLMARRSLYCSKDATSDKSIVQMDAPAGNVFFDRVEHDFDDSGRCTECRGSKEQLERGKERENYAYAFIHKDGRDKMSEVMDMQFDVIVGNPPYQMDGGGGGTNATPLYNLFVQQALELNPAYISMITPSRWLAGGRGLDGFRQAMLADRRVRALVDFPDAAELFPTNIEIKGGVSYFLWDRENEGDCAVSLVRRGDVIGPEPRVLDEFDTFVRDGRSASILRRVRGLRTECVLGLISGDTPFGLATNFDGFHLGKKKPGEMQIFAVTGGKRIKGFVSRSRVKKNPHLIEAWKVLLPEAGSDGGKQPPDVVLGKPEVAPPDSVCTQTFLVAGPFLTNDEAASFESYVRTKFFRFLVSLRKISQHAFRSTYTWVPQQKWDRTWTDAELYKKYGITTEERAYIEEMIKEMPE